MGHLETPIMFGVRRALTESGRWRGWRNNVGKTTDTHVAYGLGKGSPDLVGVLVGSGRLACFEVKAVGGRVDKHQAAWHRAARDAGAFVAVVRSGEEALAALERALSGACE